MADDPTALMRQVRAQQDLAETSMSRLLATAAALDGDQFPVPSGLPGWSRAHVLTHLARAADARSGLLAAARAGMIGRQYPSEESRERDIEAGARRAAPAIRTDLFEAFGRFREAVASHPDDRWEAEGEWLGGRRQPVHRVLPGLRREIEYHHVDLRAGYGPADWPEDFTREELGRLTRSLHAREDAPQVTIVAPQGVMRIGDGGLATVTGDAHDLLAWLSGRADGRSLSVSPDQPLPSPPPLG